ncbi:MAG: hypothetical protein Q4Q23_06580 [Methanobacteriaceae archaeon]|nr:hypothetical protein [Methanobacteriaceae archaeon]
MPTVYGLIEKFTKWDLYEKGGDPFVGSSYTLLGTIVGMIIIYPILGSCVFILPEILANDYSGGIYMALTVLIIAIYTLFGFISRPHIFNEYSANKEHPITLRNGEISYDALGYCITPYFCLIGFVGCLTTFFGIGHLFFGKLTPMTIIGLILPVILWFPDKLNKIWPIDLKTWTGFQSLCYTFIIIYIIMFLTANFIFAPLITFTSLITV